MTTSKRAAKFGLKNWMTLEETDKPVVFDADKALIADLGERCSVKSLVESVKAKNGKGADEAFSDFGREVMEATIEFVDGKYMDRTGEMIKRVAKQTGLTFPHEVQRYVELSLIGLRPFDRWNIVESTINNVAIQIQSCSVNKALRDAGAVGTDEVPCQAMCLASFAVAAGKTGDAVSMELRKTLPKDGLCEFCLSKQN
ncbi:MAG: hypothetical protein Q7O66_22955 [Dehalococcoidia bacterium]|nr:hypothetical protein [Dehalococcoidia bacterium]